MWLIRRQALERNVEMFSQTNEKLRRDLDDCEQMRAQRELTISQLRASNRDLSGKLKVEKDEVGHHYHCVAQWCFFSQMTLVLYALCS